MSERSLILHAAFDTLSARYFALGADLPCARVFDATSGSLACTVAKPRATTGQTFSLLDDSSTLTSLALGNITSSSSTGAKKSTAGRQQQQAQGAVGCAIGLSNGSMVLHNVTNDSMVCHQALSDTQQAIVSIRIIGGLVFGLAKNRLIYIYDIELGTKRPCTPNMPHGASAVDVAECEVPDTLRLVVAGTSIVVLQLKLSTMRIGKATNPVSLEKVVSFAAGAAPATHVQYCSLSKAVVTTNASDGIIRVWDTAAEATTNARCRRSLNCGGSWIVTVRVVEWSGIGNGTSASSASDLSCAVTATTYDGVSRLWTFESGLLPRGGDSGPIDAMALLAVPKSPSTKGLKVLASELIPSTRKVLLACGTTAMPQFEVINMDEAIAKKGVIPVEIKQQQQSKMQGNDADDEVTSSWATHTRTALRTAVTPSVQFQAPEMHQDKTVKNLPRPEATATSSSAVASTLGLACVALYQALHAKDYGAVMDLLSATSRSQADMAATVKLLTLPYCLQLLQVLSERATVGSVRSPMFQWIGLIIRIKGAELLQLEREMAANPLVAGEQQQTASGGGADSNPKQTLSRPSVFLAPILHRFSALTAQYDKIAHCYGRFSVFDNVRPLNRAANGGDSNTVSLNTAQFATTFKEVRSSKNEWGTAVIRVRSKKAEEHKSKKRKGNKLDMIDAIADDVADDGPLDLDNMRLDDDDDGDDGPQEKKRALRREKKKRRKEMIVDALGGYAEGELDGAGADEGDAELFAESSDDEVESGADAETSSGGEEGEEEEDYDGYGDEEDEHEGAGPDDDDLASGDSDDADGEDGADEDDELQADARDPVQRRARV